MWQQRGSLRPYTCTITLSIHTNIQHSTIVVVEQNSTVSTARPDTRDVTLAHSARTSRANHAPALLTLSPARPNEREIIPSVVHPSLSSILVYLRLTYDFSGGACSECRGVSLTLRLKPNGRFFTVAVRLFRGASESRRCYFYTSRFKKVVWTWSYLRVEGTFYIFRILFGT